MYLPPRAILCKVFILFGLGLDFECRVLILKSWFCKVFICRGFIDSFGCGFKYKSP